MYGIFPHICHKNQPNVVEYAMHGSFGLVHPLIKTALEILLPVAFVQCFPGGFSAREIFKVNSLQNLMTSPWLQHPWDKYIVPKPKMGSRWPSKSKEIIWRRTVLLLFIAFCCFLLLVACCCRVSGGCGWWAFVWLVRWLSNSYQYYHIHVLYDAYMTAVNLPSLVSCVCSPALIYSRQNCFPQGFTKICVLWPTRIVYRSYSCW